MSANGFSAKNIFVFDIETIPDGESVYNLTGSSASSVEEQREILKNYHLEITSGNNPFLRQPFHKVVSISFLIASVSYDSSEKEVYTLKEIRSGGKINSKEEDLVSGFFSTIDKIKPKIISFNGKTFDMPVLKYRAMKYGISADFFYLSGNKYESYNNRYASNWHCDLIDSLSDFGLSARIKLHEVCSILGFPGKFGVDGADVSKMYDSGQLPEIRNYCETDVVNTYLVYLRYALHSSKISLESYHAAIQDLINFLGAGEDHFLEFLSAWKKSSYNDPLSPFKL